MKKIGSKLKYLLILGSILLLPLCLLSAAQAATEQHSKLPPEFDYHPDYIPVETPPDAPEQRSHKTPGETADHSKFKELQQDFKSGPEVTKACLTCHNKAGEHFIKTTHWTWEYKNPETGQVLGKKTLVNNFCTNSRGNEGVCAQCHAGFGWKDDSFDFTDQTKIDCVVCHDNTGLYYRMPQSTGNAACSVMFEDVPTLDWKKLAQGVGMPRRRNCGSCHFYGGGGDGVKHGDLDSSLFHPDKTLDVHMDEKGLNFACTACHVTKNHVVSGSRYNVLAKDEGGTGKPGLRRDVTSCESCHGEAPHPGYALKSIKLNNHVDKVACQTCHIPRIARGGVATVTDWDWRTAGKLIDGFGFFEHGYVQGNGEARKTYKSIKGSFKYDENFVPHYDWFDGQMLYKTIDTKLDPAEQPVAINAYKGAYDDERSRIWPFKRTFTFQPYDKGFNTLVYTHLWGKDDTAFWGTYDFEKAIAAGMKKYDLPYSGEFGFIETYTSWPITHMVAPKEQALACQECHTKGGRLEKLEGFYMPGRDANKWVDLLGLLAVVGTFLGVLGHGLIRKLSAKKG